MFTNTTIKSNINRQSLFRNRGMGWKDIRRKGEERERKIYKEDGRKEIEEGGGNGRREGKICGEEKRRRGEGNKEGRKTMEERGRQE